MEYLKFMEKGCVGPYSGRPLEPDVWLPEVEGELVLCENGYHLCKPEHAINWFNEEAYSVEFKEPVLFGEDKICAASIRMTRIPAWNERTARLFAADCAERLLPIFEERFPADDRPAKAIEAVRLFANGEITKKQMDAARAAAGAAWAAAGVARDAAWVARDIARDAARAAWAAAGDAGDVWDVGDAGDVAWVARAAARAAAGAAWVAAGDAWAARAARDVARDARDIAGDAERAWQSVRLMQYIKGEVGQ